MSTNDSQTPSWSPEDEERNTRRWNVDDVERVARTLSASKGEVATLIGVSDDKDDSADDVSSASNSDAQNPDDVSITKDDNQPDGARCFGHGVLAREQRRSRTGLFVLGLLAALALNVLAVLLFWPWLLDWLRAP